MEDLNVRNSELPEHYMVNKTNIPVRYYSVVEYFNTVLNQAVSLEEVVKHDKFCTRMCRDLGVGTGTVPDWEFGKLKTYPLAILEEFIN